MKYHNKRKIKEIISYLLVIVWMLIIFLNSSKPATISSNESDTLIRQAIKISSKITKKNYSNNDINHFIKVLTYPVRKTGHLLEYFILAFLIFNALNNSHYQINKKYLICLIICLIYSCTDEIHQIFVPGRAGMITDILIDTLGCLLYLIPRKIIIKR